MHKIVRLSVIAAVVLLGLIALIAAQNNQVNAAGGGPGTAAAVGTSAQVIGGDEASLREMLGRVVGGSPYPNQQSVVYVGQLPDKLPFEMPLPEGARVIGSVTFGTPGYTQIIVDTPQSPSEVVQFFRDSLKSEQWQPVENYPTNSVGFVAQPSSSANFCYQQNQAMLNVNAEADEKITHVLLYINMPDEGITCTGASEAMVPGAPYSLLPQLKTPEGVTLLPSSGAGGSAGTIGFRSAIISTDLNSKLSINAIAEAYNQQLDDLGWQPLDSEMGDRIAQSGWTLKDTDGKSWTGLFLLTANPVVEDQYMAQLSIQEIPAQ